MSDYEEEEEEYEYEEEEEYEYEDQSDFGSDEDGENGGGGASTGDAAIEIENSFYEADDCKTDEPLRAVELFERVVELETTREEERRKRVEERDGAEVAAAMVGEIKWRFKALEQLVKLKLRAFGGDSTRRDQALAHYQVLLGLIGQVTRNESTDAVNGVLDAVTESVGVGTVGRAATGAAGAGASTAVPLKEDLVFLITVYDTTLQALRDANNERLWFTTNLKLAKTHMRSAAVAGGSGPVAAEAYTLVRRILDELLATCRNADGTDDETKGSSLLEVYAVEIMLCRATNNEARMRQIYPRTLNLNAAVADPRIMGGIREEGGKMHMGHSKWQDAYEEFYQGFRAYQEAGNSRAKDLLKYVVLANMLAKSDINPFAAHEARAYHDDKEIKAMMQLRYAYDANDLTKFDRILNNPQNHIVDDPFMMTYIAPLCTRMREQVLHNLVQPYEKVTVAFIARELRVSEEETETLIVHLIQQGLIAGHIDQINGFLQLEKNDTGSSNARKLAAAGNWAAVLRQSIQSMGLKVSL